MALGRHSGGDAKPDLLPLTGDYRRMPILQVGADAYCDTSLILRRLNALRLWSSAARRRCCDRPP